MSTELKITELKEPLPKAEKAVSLPQGQTKWRWKRIGYAALVYLGVLIFLTWTLIPLIWLFGTAFKLPRDYAADPPVLIPSEATIDGFNTAFGQFKAGNFLLNSV